MCHFARLIFDVLILDYNVSPSLVTLQRASMDDSGEDLFITQSTFRSEDVDTQEAGEAVDFLNLSMNVYDASAPETVEYWDFSNERRNSSTSDANGASTNVLPDNNVVVGQEPILPLEPAFQVEDFSSNISDEVLSAAIDAVAKEKPAISRHGEPVSDDHVKQNTGKR